MTILGRNIKYLRNKQGITQTELGKICGLKKHSISYIETKIVTRSAAHLKIISEYFGYEVEHLKSFVLEDVTIPKPIPNQTASLIERLLISYGYCIGTANKFTG